MFELENYIFFVKHAKLYIVYENFRKIKIEGSTLTENETGAILFQNKAIPNKSLTEQLEAKNHQTALHFLYDFVAVKNAIDEKFVLKLHSILMNGVHPDAGFYRRHGVRIVGTHVVTANYAKVPFLMEKLVTEINRKTSDLISQTASVHARFEQIHPFPDGNGRIGRLLMHAMLLRGNFPPAIIHQEDRQKYFTYLQKAQLKGDISLLEDFLCDAVLAGFKVFDDTFEDAALGYLAKEREQNSSDKDYVSFQEVKKKLSL